METDKRRLGFKTEFGRFAVINLMLLSGGRVATWPSGDGPEWEL